MKLHLISDGTTPGTQVLDENNHRIEGIQQIDIQAKAGEPFIKVYLLMRFDQLDIFADSYEVTISRKDGEPNAA